jgi:hypothetical protein
MRSLEFQLAKQREVGQGVESNCVGTPPAKRCHFPGRTRDVHNVHVDAGNLLVDEAVGCIAPVRNDWDKLMRRAVWYAMAIYLD